MRVFLQVLLSAAALLAQQAIPAQPAPLPEERCFQLYREGEYERTVDCINSVLYAGEIRDTVRLLRAYEYLGVSLTMLDKREPGKAAFLKLLSLNPEFELNPNVYLPDIISLFQIAKFQHRTSLRVLVMDTVAAYPRLYNYLPAGVPQWHNRQKVKAGTFFALQLLSVGASVWAYNRENSFETARYGIRDEDYQDALFYDRTQKLCLLTFIAAYVYGLVDGIINKPITFKQ